MEKEEIRKFSSPEDFLQRKAPSDSLCHSLSAHTLPSSLNLSMIPRSSHLFDHPSPLSYVILLNSFPSNIQTMLEVCPLSSLRSSPTYSATSLFWFYSLSTPSNDDFYCQVYFALPLVRKPSNMRSVLGSFCSRALSTIGLIISVRLYILPLPDSRLYFPSGGSVLHRSLFFSFNSRGDPI